MDNVVQSVRQSVMNFRVKRCCWLAPLRAGLMALGYLNLVVGVVLAVGASSGSLAPLLQRAQMALMEGEYYPSVCILSPVVDVAAAVLLLCGLHREDVRLLSLFSVVSTCCVVLSVAVYVVLCATLSAVDLIAIFCTEVYQVYVIFLVRSLIVEIRLKTSSYRHGGGMPPISKVTKMPPIIEKVDVEGQVGIQEPQPVEYPTVEESQSLSTETITQHVQVQVERADSPVEVVSETPRATETPNIEVTGTATNAPGTATNAPEVPGTATNAPGTATDAPEVPGTATNAPEVPGTATDAPEVPESTPVEESVQKVNIGNDDVTRKTRRKQCRVM